MTNAVNIAQGGSNNVTFRNRIINGGMVIDQRNAGASVTPVNGQYTLDRWVYSLAQTSKLTTQQSTTAPTGFANSLLVTSSSAYSVLTGDNFNVLQWIEGYNTADLAWGTASAATVTLSFWVRSSLTGTFGGSIVNNNQNYSYPFSYTISAANTFEYKTITIAGPTAGTWSNTTTTRNIGVWIGLGAGASASGTAGAWAATGYYNATGATSVVGTNGATFYITGVQLEAGTTASPFEYRQYGTELVLCQRYFETNTIGTPINSYGGFAAPPYNNLTSSIGVGTFRTTKRAAPTVVLYDNTGTVGTCTQVGVANAIPATAGSITVAGFQSIERTSSSFASNAFQPVVAGYTASAEL